MEDIEYLEGYEDLVLPVNSCAGSFVNNPSVNTDVTIKGTITEKANYDEYDSDASSSSIDPEIFNYFFDVHSDDDPLPENKVEHILNQKEDSMDSTDNLVKDLEEQVVDELQIKSTVSKTSATLGTMSVMTSNSTGKTKSKVVPSTSKPESSTIKNNRIVTTKESSSSSSIKSKSLTVRNQRTQLKRNPKSSNTSSACPRSGVSANTKPTSSTTLTAMQLNLGSFKKTKIQIKPPATIVRPEKIINNDPEEDPLNLDNLSDVASDLYTISDISGETFYHTLSELDDDDDDDILGTNNMGAMEDEDFSSASQIIELTHHTDSIPSNLNLKTTTLSSTTLSRKDMPSTSASCVKIESRENHKVTYNSKQRNVNLSDSRKFDRDGGSIINAQIDNMNISTDVLDARTAKVIESLPTKAIIISDTILMPYTPSSDLKKFKTELVKDANTTTDKKKPIQVSITPIPGPGIKPPTDLISPSNNSNDSNLSTVDEMLEESYAEAMLKIKAQQEMENLQDVGAELEISFIDSVAAVAVKKVQENLKIELKNVKETITERRDSNLATIKKIPQKSKIKEESSNEAKKQNTQLIEKSSEVCNKEKEIQSNKEKGAHSLLMTKTEGDRKANKLGSDIANETSAHNANPQTETIVKKDGKVESNRKQQTEIQLSDAKPAIPPAISRIPPKLRTSRKEVLKPETGSKGNEIEVIISSVPKISTKQEIKLKSDHRADEKASNIAKSTVTTGASQTISIKSSSATAKEDSKVENDQKNIEIDKNFAKVKVSSPSNTSMKLKFATKEQVEQNKSQKENDFESNIDKTTITSISEAPAKNLIIKKEVVKPESDQKENETASSIAKSKNLNVSQISKTRKLSTKQQQLDNKLSKDHKDENEMKTNIVKHTGNELKTSMKEKCITDEVITTLESVRKEEDETKSNNKKTIMPSVSQTLTKSRSDTKEVEMAHVQLGQKDNDMPPTISTITSVNDKQKIFMKSVFTPKVKVDKKSGQKESDLQQQKATSTCLSQLSTKLQPEDKEGEGDQRSGDIKPIIADAVLESISQISANSKAISRQMEAMENNQKPKEVVNATTVFANVLQKSSTKVKVITEETGGKENEAEKNVKKPIENASNTSEKSELVLKANAANIDETSINFAARISSNINVKPKLSPKDADKDEISQKGNVTNSTDMRNKEIKLNAMSTINQDKIVEKFATNEQKVLKDNEKKSDRSLPNEELKGKENDEIKNSTKGNNTAKSEKKYQTIEKDTKEEPLITSTLPSKDKKETENLKYAEIESDKKKTAVEDQKSSINCCLVTTNLFLDKTKEKETNILVENKNIEAELNDLQAIIEQSKREIAETDKSAKPRSRRKRFRNLRTPEIPTSEDELKDIFNDFKGFENSKLDAEEIKMNINDVQEVVVDGNESSSKNKTEEQRNDDEKNDNKKHQMGIELNNAIETHKESQGTKVDELSKHEDIGKYKISEKSKPVQKFKHKEQKYSLIKPAADPPPTEKHSEKISNSDRNLTENFGNVYESRGSRNSKDVNKQLPTECKVKSDKKDVGRLVPAIIKDFKSSGCNESRRTPTRRDKKLPNDRKESFISFSENNFAMVIESKSSTKIDKTEPTNLRGKKHNNKDEKSTSSSTSLKDEKDERTRIIDNPKRSKDVVETETNLNVMKSEDIKVGIKKPTDPSKRDDKRNSKESRYSKDSQSSIESFKDRKEIKSSPTSTPSKQKIIFKDKERKESKDSCSSRESSKDRKDSKSTKQISSPPGSSKQKFNFKDTCNSRESSKERKDIKPTIETSSLKDSFKSLESLNERRDSKLTKEIYSGTGSPSKQKSLIKDKETRPANNDFSCSRESLKELKDGKKTVEILSNANRRVKSKEARSLKDSCSSRDSSKERKDDKMSREICSTSSIISKQKSNFRDNETRSSKDSCNPRDAAKDRKGNKLTNETQQKSDLKSKELTPSKEYRSSRDLMKESKGAKLTSETCSLTRTSSKEKLDNSVTNLKGGSKKIVISKDIIDSKQISIKSKDFCGMISLSSRESSSSDSKGSENQKLSTSSRDSSRDSKDDKAELSSPKERKLQIKGSSKEIFIPPKTKSATPKSTTSTESKPSLRVEKETLQPVKSNAKEENKTNEKSAMKEEKDNSNGKSGSKLLEKLVAKSSIVEEPENINAREVSTGKKTSIATAIESEEKTEKGKMTKPNIIEKIAEKIKGDYTTEQKSLHKQIAENSVEKPEEKTNDSIIANNNKAKENIKEKTTKCNATEKPVDDVTEKITLHNPTATIQEANDKKINNLMMAHKLAPDNVVSVEKLPVDKLTTVLKSSPNNTQTIRKDNNCEVLDESSTKLSRILRDRSKGDQKARQEELSKTTSINDKSLLTTTMEASKVSKAQEACTELKNSSLLLEEQNKSSDELSKYLITHKYRSSPTNSISSQSSDTRRAATPIGNEVNLRRNTLRKRGTESPFIEKDEAKRLFKEPQIQKKGGTKIPKQEEVSIIFSSPVISLVQNKRNLRSPNNETNKDDLPTFAKKPKLDLTRKSLRSRKTIPEESEELETKASAQSPVKKVKVEVKSLPFRQENKDQTIKQQLNKSLMDLRMESTAATSSPTEAINENEEKFLEKQISTNLEEKNNEMNLEEMETILNDSKAKNDQFTCYTKSVHSEDNAKQQNNSNEENVKNTSNKCITETTGSSTALLSSNKKANLSEKSSCSTTSVMTFTEWLQTQKKTMATEEDGTQKVTIDSAAALEMSCSTKDIHDKVLSAKISTDKIKKEQIARRNNRRGYQKFWRNRKVSRKSPAMVADIILDNNTTVNSVERSSTSTPKGRIKRSETEALMDSWSKKMKESILNANNPLEKRQRSTLKKLSLSAATTVGKSNKPSVSKETIVAVEKATPPIVESTKQQQQKVQKIGMTGTKILPPTESASAIVNMAFPKPQVFGGLLDGTNKKLKTYENTRKKLKGVNLSPTSKIEIDFKAPQKKTEIIIKDKHKLPIRRLIVRINRSVVRKYLQTYRQIEIDEPSITKALFKEPNLIAKEAAKVNKTVTSRVWTNNRERITSSLPITNSPSLSPSSSRIPPKTPSISNASHVPLVTNNPQTGLRIGVVISRGNVVTVTPQQTLATPQVIGGQSSVNNIVPNTKDFAGNKKSDNNTSALPPLAISSTTTTSTAVSSKTADITAACMPVKSLPLVNEDDAFVALQPKHEIDDDPLAALPDTPTLMARAQSITAAAVNAMNSSYTGINSQQPTNIRLLNSTETTDSYQNSFVSSFGVTPPLLDAKGTRLYSFLHPIKYNRNHGNVLLDYCCPYLDGNMPAIDPTRMHTQVHTPIKEIPAYIVLTTKVITRAELESSCSTIPDVVRQKAEKLRTAALISNNQQTCFTNPTTITSTTSTLTANTILSPPLVSSNSTLSANAILSPAINALARHLPRTTTITPKIRAAVASQETNPIHVSSPTNCAVPSVAQQQKEQQQDTDPHRSMNRTNFKRLDVLIKKFVKPFDQLTLADRHRVIESLSTTCKFQSKDLENTIMLIEEYLKQVLHLNDVSSSISTVPSNTCVQTTATDLSSTTASVFSQDISDTSLTTATVTKHKSTNYETSRRSVQVHEGGVPIYDTEKNIIGYQLQTVPPHAANIPAYTKSTMSTRHNIMSTGKVASTSFSTSPSTSNSLSAGRTNAVTQKRTANSLKRSSQESSAMFYATPPLRTSTPIIKPVKMKPTTPVRKAATAATTGMRKFPSLSNTGTAITSSSILPMPSSETVCIITAAAKTRVTRKSTAKYSKIAVLSKSRNNDDGSVLLIDNHRTLVKNEQNVEDLND